MECDVGDDLVIECDDVVIECDVDDDVGVENVVDERVGDRKMLASVVISNGQTIVCIGLRLSASQLFLKAIVAINLVNGIINAHRAIFKYF